MDRILAGSNSKLSGEDDAVSTSGNWKHLFGHGFDLPFRAKSPSALAQGAQVRVQGVTGQAVFQ